MCKPSPSGLPPGVVKVLIAALSVAPVGLEGQVLTTAEGVTQTFAERWAQPGSPGLVETLDPSGVLLAVYGREHRDLDRPKLLATVAQVHGDAVAGGVRLLRIVPVAGSPDRAFAELVWEAVMAGTSESIEQTIYLGLVFRDGRWWINEIRLLG